MGKSNYLNINNQIISKIEKIHSILNIEEIKILDKIHEDFIKEIIIYFSNFIKNEIKLNFFSIKINSYTDSDENIKYLFANEIEIVNSNEKSFIFFSDNLLSVFIDLLFGGNGTCIEKINKTRKITYTEKIISQKILKLILNSYCKSFKKICSINIDSVQKKIFNIKKNSLMNVNYITNYFNFSVNDIKIFLSILLPISIVKKNFQQQISSENNKKYLIKNTNIKKNIPSIDLYDIELDVITKLIILSKISYNSLSIGDVLIIENPDIVISYIEKTPIFLGSYKNFDKKSVVFFKKFIHKNLDLNKYKEFL